MAKKRKSPPTTVHDMIDDLVGGFVNTVEDLLYSAAERLKAQAGTFTPILPSGPVPNQRPGPQKRPGKGQKPVQATKPRAPVRTAYTALGVAPDADVEVIQAAYKALARKYHPDINPGKGSADRMGEVNAAWAILKDPGKRREYDRGMGIGR